MMSTPEQNNARERAAEYLLGEPTQPEPLGSGKDGIVFATYNQSAVKVYRHRTTFANELAVYERLAELRVEKVCGHNVPQLIGSDDRLSVLEMTTVAPPFALDFAFSYVDWPPDFDDERWETWHAKLMHDFGDKYEAAVAIYQQFERWGIYYMDMNVGNVVFGN